MLGLALLAVTTGCGVELTAGGLREGEVRAVATSEQGGSSSLTSDGPSFSYAMALGSDAGGAAEPQGTVSFNAQVTLVAENGDTVPLTRGAVASSFRIEGEDSSLVARSDVQTRTYTRARITFSEVHSNVGGGVLIDGVPLLGHVFVQMGAGGTVVVDAPIQLTVREDRSHTLVIDLNAHIWLARATLRTGGSTVAAADFRNAVEVRTR